MESKLTYRQFINSYDKLNKQTKMTAEELQTQLNETWYQNQSADDAHDAIWGEPFEGYTVPISEVEKLKNELDSWKEVVKHLKWKFETFGVLTMEDFENY